MSKSQSNRLLGYPPDARLLIINADDVGMCHAVNEAIEGTLQEGLVRSASLMVPCPWSAGAVHFLKDHADVPFGVHLTVVSDPVDYRWRPLTSREKAPSLVDREGYLYNFETIHAILDQLRLSELEVEFRAQIEAVRAAGLQPTHLDWHALRFGRRTDIFDLMARLAAEYGLALRVIGRAAIERLQRQGLPTIDYDFLDSYGIDPLQKGAIYARLLRELPPGLSEWAVHPGLDTPELLAIEPGEHRARQTDFDFWVSETARDIVKAEGIILIDYRALQPFWR